MAVRLLRAATLGGAVAGGLAVTAAAVPTARAQPAPMSAASFDALYAEALRARREGDFPRAIGLLHEAVRARPEDADAALLLGTLLGFERRFAEARAVLGPALERNPGYLDLRIALARVRAFEGDHAGAEAVLAPVLEADPSRAEAHELAGRIAYYRNDLDRAERAFRRALDVAPRSLDALVGLGDVARARGQEADARTWWLEAQAVDPGSRDVADRLARRPPRDEPRWRADLGASGSRLRRGIDDEWREGFAQLAWLPAKERSYWVRGGLGERFGETDLHLEAGAARRFGEAWAGEVAVAGSPDADVREDLSARVAGSARLTGLGDGGRIGPLSATARARAAWYGSSLVVTAAPGLALDLLSGGATLAAELVGTRNVEEGGGADLGWAVRLDTPPATLLPVGLGVGYARTPETIDARTRDTEAVFGHVTFRLDGARELRLDVAREDREDSYTRTSASVALAIRF